MLIFSYISLTKLSLTNFPCLVVIILTKNTTALNVIKYKIMN